MNVDHPNAHRIPLTIISEVKKMMPCTPLFHEAMGKKGNMDPSIKPVAQNTIVVGPARTVRTISGDNLTLHRALMAAQPGEIIVADCQGHSEYGYWGEFMSRVAMARHIEGLVIDGGIRDVVAIRRLGFRAFARGISMAGTFKRGAGTLNKTITCGGVRVRSGDLVLGDDDGVVVVPSHQIVKVLANAMENAKKENGDLLKILRGRMSYGEFLRKKGWLMVASVQKWSASLG